MTKLPGGEFGGAWAALAACAPRRRRGRGGDFPLYSTAELLRDLNSPSLDDATRVKIENEIARRQNRCVKT